MVLRLLIGALALIPAFGRPCNADLFFEQFAQSVAIEIARDTLQSRLPVDSVQTEPSPSLDCEPPKELFHRRVWIFIEGGDIDQIAQQAEAYNQHRFTYPGLRRSQLCSTQATDQFRFRYINEVSVRFGFVAVPIRATTLSEHAARHGSTGANRRWIKSASSFVDEVPRDLSGDLCAATLSNNSKYLSRIETLWLFDRRPTGVFVTSDVVMLMKAGVNWIEQKALRDTLTRVTDETLRVFLDRFRKKSR